MADEQLSAPFIYFGGKRRAAEAVWRALGDVGGYVEPFAGSAAVLLARPAVSGRRVETLNDLDGWLVNFWRAVKYDPEDVLRWTLAPVMEAEYHARLAWLQERRQQDLVSWLEGAPDHFDAKAAGFWVYAINCGIGDPFGPGPWYVREGRLVDSRLEAERVDGAVRQMPHLSSAGQGLNSGAVRQLPSIGQAGRGIFSERGADIDGRRRWLLALSERLSDTRITCGSWDRIMTPAALRATAGPGSIGIFFDPPYATSGDVYAVTNRDDDANSISAQVRAWCIENAHGYRVVLCGFGDEHDELLEHGWRVEAGKSGSGAGYNNDPRAGKRERLWLSPACLDPSNALFDFDSVQERA
ncbi:DNA adenine methylase [Gryllotalpicola protaetiae]|uniref:DNA adenine methylase n=1 Tax=Gryllotalpicola protaetiae TaxID=2419771 RepID=A0A387BJR2_9MICO|nr:DNA adenine methylase [Gryllotalpicola protaetiae]AYG02394.1 DNA adenine methylase [Gryllotalpicola protaetiae]